MYDVEKSRVAKFFSQQVVFLTGATSGLGMVRGFRYPSKFQNKRCLQVSIFLIILRYVLSSLPNVSPVNFEDDSLQNSEVWTFESFRVAASERRDERTRAFRGAQQKRYFR